MSNTLNIQSIKNTFLKVRWFFNSKKIESIRSSKNYKDAKKVGILFSSEDEKDYRSLEKFVQELKKDQKTVRVMVFEPNSIKQELNETPSENHELFNYRDISLLGEIKKEEVKSFLNDSYDYICCITSHPHPILEYILQTTATGCRIGNYYTASDVFEMTIETQASENLSNSFTEILRYWRNISVN